MKGYGLALGGGGAKGSYEIGVWKALKELNVPISAISGTSVGALNGAIIVQDEFETAYSLWSNICIHDIINTDKFSLFDGSKFTHRHLKAIIKEILDNRGLDVTPLKQLLKKYVNEDKIRKSPIDFGLVAYSLSKLKPHIMYKNDIPHGKLVEYLIASSCFPIFKPHTINNQKFIDGGIYDNLPISLLSDKGIKDIIVVDVSGIGRVKRVNDKSLNLIHIKNSEFLGKTFFFDKNACKRNIQIGYLDAMKAFKKYSGKRYYIHSHQNIKLLHPLTNCEITMLESLLDLKNTIFSAKKLANYNIIRTLYKYIDGKLNTTTAIYASAEVTAEVLGVDRLKAYDWEDLADNILKKYCEIKNSTQFNKNIGQLKTYLSNKNSIILNSIDNKYLVAYLTSLDPKETSLSSYQKLLAVFSPKICIASIFLPMLLNRAV